MFGTGNPLYGRFVASRRAACLQSNGDTPMRGFIWLVLALLLFLAWVGSYIVYHVAGILIHLLLVFALLSLLVHIYSEIKDPGPRD